MKITKQSLFEGSQSSNSTLRRLAHVVPVVLFSGGATLMVLNSLPQEEVVEATRGLATLKTVENHHPGNAVRSNISPVASKSFSNLRSHDSEKKKDLSMETSVTTSTRRRLLPSQVVSQIGPASSGSTSWRSQHNVVHVINTRFLQHQNKLVHLATARLDLFQTFTLPSMLQQTNQEFLWIIWTGADSAEQQDPQDKAMSNIHQELRRLIQQVPNAVLITGVEQDKDANFRHGYGHSVAALSEAVAVGSVQLLQDYYQASQTHLLLETRLDADDALSQSFVASIQAQAAAAMGGKRSQTKSASEFFCPESHAEWRYYSGNDDPSQQHDEDSGKLVHFHNQNFCIFSGLTWAFDVESVGDGRSAVPKRSLQANNNGNNCPPDGGMGCDVNRRLEQLFEEVVVQKTKRNHRELHGHGGGSCDLVDVACYKCGQYLECFVSDHGLTTAELQPILTWLQTTGGETSDAFCRIGSNGKGQTCAGQQCTPSSSQVSQSEGLKAFGLSSGLLAPANTCPIIGSATCPNVGKDLSNFATYQVEYCTSGFVGMETCDVQGGKCDSGTCTCQHGWSDFCGGCDIGDDDDDDSDGGATCRRQLRLLPEHEEQSQTEELSLFGKDIPAASVLLSRTPTAAGMKNVLPNQKGGGENSLVLPTFDGQQQDAWQHMEHEFGVSQLNVENLRDRFEHNLEAILIDAFAGQCTPGHSCKESTKKSLGLLLNQVQHRKKH